MRKNLVLEKLRAGKSAHGVLLMVGSPILAEEAAHAGVDWLFLDEQHGYWTDETLLSAIQIISHTDTMPIVRTSGNDPVRIGRAMDNGAMGVIVPLVNTREDAVRAVDAVRYPPAGKRSAGGNRLVWYGSDYFSGKNTELFVAVMLETAQALENAEAILTVPGVDCGYIGPTDLGLDMSLSGESLEEAMAAILAVGKRCGVPVGIPCGGAERAKKRVAQGFQLVDIGSDAGFFSQGMGEANKVWTS